MENNFFNNNIPKFMMGLCGKTGAGKTTTLLGLVKPQEESKDRLINEIYDNLNPVLYLDCEEKAKIRIRKLGKDKNNLLLKEIKTIDDLSRAFTWAVKNQDKYKSIVIDGLQRIQTKGLRKFATGKEVPDFQSPDKIGIQHYGYNQNQVELIMESLQDMLPDKFKFISCLLNEVSKDDEPTRYALALPNKQQAIIPAVWDVTSMIEINRKMERMFTCNPTRKATMLKDTLEMFGDQDILKGNPILMGLYKELKELMPKPAPKQTKKENSTNLKK